MSWHGRGYGQTHWKGCSCEECEATYARHNTEVWCACQGCQDRNLVKNNAYQTVGNLEVEVKADMATINICDRCESMMSSNAAGKIAWRTEPAHGMDELQLCPGCVEDFMQFKDGDVTMATRQRAYREPWKPNQDDSGEIVYTQTQVKALLKELGAGKEPDVPRTMSGPATRPYKPYNSEEEDI